MTEPTLPRDVFIALAAIAWADGTLDPEEADAIVRAAADAGLDLELINEIEDATKAKVDIGVLERSSLSKEDRLFVYAVACWIAQIDGRVTEDETHALASLGEKLGIPERPRANAEAVAKQIASLPDGDRPYRYDLTRLRETIRARLDVKATSGGDRLS